MFINGDVADEFVGVMPESAVAQWLQNALPDANAAAVDAAEALLLSGRTADALRMLEDLREAKPAKFEYSGDDDAWYRSAQILGDLYLNEFNRPDLAVLQNAVGEKLETPTDK